MKNWQRPAAVGQKFAANDYVSACTVTVECDFWPSDAPACENSGPHRTGLDIPWSTTGKIYNPCGDDLAHEVNVNDLKEVTFTTGYKSTLYPDTTFNITPATAYYWYDEDGDFHATSITADQLAAANKS